MVFRKKNVKLLLHASSTFWSSFMWENLYAVMCMGHWKEIVLHDLGQCFRKQCACWLLKTQLTLREALLCEGEFFHIHCCAHILNLIVQDSLKEIDESIQKIRESIKYVRGLLVRKKKFLKCVSQVSVEIKKGLRQNIPTRWNSTFLWLRVPFIIVGLL